MASLSKQTLRPGLRITGGRVLPDAPPVNGRSRSRHLASQGVRGQVAALGRGGRCDAPTPLRCSRPWPVAQLAAFADALSAQTSATSQTTKRAARAATATALLGASHGALRPAHARLGNRGVGTPPVESHFVSWLRQALSGGGDFWGGCDRQPGAGRASARFVSDSRPLSERRERSERSEFGRAGPRLVGAAESAHRADRPSMSPRRTAPAAAARCSEREPQHDQRFTPKKQKAGP